MRTIKFFTAGCKVNQYDTQNIRERFLSAGFKEADAGIRADVYVVNTCTVTRQADKGSLSIIRKSRRENPHAEIIVTGCLAELDEDKIRDVSSKITVIKNKDKGNILFHLKIPLCPPFYKGGIKGDYLNEGISYFKGHTRAFLKIQDGCNNFCSYCKVPLVRGRSISKPLDAAVNEAAQLVRSGFKEIVLCGICLGAYGKDLTPCIGIVEVIDRLEKIDGLLRIRLSSIEPNDVSDELIGKIGSSSKLCPHLHIPLQSADDRILVRMNRKYTAAEYSDLIDRIKDKIPQIAVTTDILLGFPGENEANFRNTVRLLKKIVPLNVHIFPYSPRQGTAAALLDSGRRGAGADKTIKRRIGFLKEITDDLSRQYKERFLHKTIAVLVEGRCKEKTGFWEGRTGNYIKIMLKSNRDLRNKYLYAELTGIYKDYAEARLLCSGREPEIA